MFTLRRKTGNPDSFFDMLQARAKEWANAKIAARIVVPDDLRWWYWQEFGTATGGRSHQVDETGGASGSKYEIRPTNVAMLSWTENGQTVYRPVVQHPGVPSHHFVTRTLQDNLEMASIKIVAAMDRSKWNVDTVRQSLLEEVMPRVKENIVEMIGLTLGGGDPDGKLGGRSAAEVFEAESQIVDSSGA